MADSEDYAEALDQISNAIIYRVESKELGRLVNDIRNSSHTRINLQNYQLPAKLREQIAKQYRCKNNELVLGGDNPLGNAFQFEKKKSVVESEEKEANEDEEDDDAQAEEEEPKQQNWSPHKTPPTLQRKLGHFRAPQAAPNAPARPSKKSDQSVPSGSTKRNLAAVFVSDNTATLSQLKEEKKNIMEELKTVQQLIDDCLNDGQKKILEADKQEILSRVHKNLEKIKQLNQQQPQQAEPEAKKLKPALKKPMQKPKSQPETSGVATLASYANAKTNDDNNNDDDDDDDADLEENNE